MSEGGASSESARIKPNSVEGEKNAALAAQGFASLGIRLANNVEVGVEVCGALVQQSKQK